MDARGLAGVFVAALFDQSINFMKPTVKKVGVDPLCSAKIVIAQCVYEFENRIWQRIQRVSPAFQ
jgi:hypothetical protein